MSLSFLLIYDWLYLGVLDYDNNQIKLVCISPTTKLDLISAVIIIIIRQTLNKKKDNFKKVSPVCFQKRSSLKIPRMN